MFVIGIVNDNMSALLDFHDLVLGQDIWCKPSHRSDYPIRYELETSKYSYGMEMGRIDLLPHKKSKNTKEIISSKLWTL